MPGALRYLAHIALAKGSSTSPCLAQSASAGNARKNRFIGHLQFVPPPYCGGDSDAILSRGRWRARGGEGGGRCHASALCAEACFPNGGEGWHRFSCAPYVGVSRSGRTVLRG